MIFSINDLSIKNDLEDVVRLFYPDFGLRFLPSAQELPLAAEVSRARGKIFIKITAGDTIIHAEETADFDAENSTLYKRFYKRFCKNALYKALKGYTSREMPWGSLTGIRPTRPARELAAESPDGIYNPAEMSSRYFLSSEKALLLGRILDAQRGFFFDGSYVNLYVHIPFCKTRCNYCSFPADSINRVGGLLPQYAEALEKEIAHARGLIDRHGKKLLSSYIGGGTPSSIPDVMLRGILSAASPGRGAEYTLEAGRPDSITESNMAAAKDAGVTRVCVNPQTFCGETLQRIGRGHTVEEFYGKYSLAKSFGFDLNTDLIAGLSGEDFDTFRYSLDKAAGLRPDNITVHTLSIKSGSKLKEDAEYAGGCTDRMTAYSAEALTAAGYVPYYIYRQKYMTDNGENTGWCIPGKQCVNNISVMEELNSVVACGCGAISKFIFPSGGRIERLANPKDLRLYLANLDVIMAKKEKMLENSLH